MNLPECASAFVRIRPIRPIPPIFGIPSPRPRDARVFTIHYSRLVLRGTIKEGRAIKPCLSENQGQRMFLAQLATQRLQTDQRAA